MRFKPEIYGVRIGGDVNYFSACVGQEFTVNRNTCVVESIIDDHNYREQFRTELIEIFLKDKEKGDVFLWKAFKNSNVAITYKRN